MRSMVFKLRVPLMFDQGEPFEPCPPKPPNGERGTVNGERQTTVARAVR
jgi:hypothetical protein